MIKSVAVDLPAFKIQALEDGNVARTITNCSFGRDGHRHRSLLTAVYQ